ncbi:probable Vacuolar protein sorting-associated protein 13 [Zygosaccharomyces bailii]|nr:probable Vacuolar protein sorting-associated protein 13 [Zygosaccharomyces bailii]
MLESLAATLLNRLLGSYVENFDPNQLNVGIWGGNVKLKNLKLRKDCFDGFHLPIDVKFGILGDLVLNVPWSSLKNKPVKVNIEDCYLLCTPRDFNSLHSQEQVERELRVKIQKLASWEVASQARAAAEDPSANKDQNESFTQSLITKVVDNVQVTIKNIHIRYEDMNAHLSKDACSVGITLNELSAVSSDSNWNPSFISITQDITHKLLTLNSFCLYWNTNTGSLEDEDGSLDPEKMIAKFKDCVATSGVSVPNFQYMLRPVTGSGRLTVNKLGPTESRPHIELQMLYDEFGLEIDDTQYADILHTLSSIHLSQKTQKFKKKRPNFAVEQNPREWFRYVGHCVMEEIHERNEMWTWDSIKKHCEQRRLYVKLWSKKLLLGSWDQPLPDKEEEKTLEQLQRELSFEDIILFRSLGRKEYAKQKLKSRDSSPATSQQGNTQGGWFSSWWGGEHSSQNSDLTITDEQRKELYDAIEFEEKDGGLGDMQDMQIPRDRTTMKVTGLLRKGAFSMKKKDHVACLGEVIFENCEVELLQRPDSFLASFKLHQFKVEDGSPNTLYKHIISVRNPDSDIAEKSLTQSNPLFQLTFESNPIDESADSKLNVVLRGMTVFYHVHFITEIMNFFSPPKQHMDTIGAIINAAEATVEGWTTQTRMGLESLLEEHKTANVTLDLQAPLIILPLNPHSWETPCAVVDVGHIFLKSDLVPKEKLDELKQMSPEEYEKIDDSELNKLMFDRYQLCLQDTQMLIGPDVRSTVSSLNGAAKGSHFSILNKLRLELTLDLSILPKAFNLPKIRAFGRLPQLKLSLNDDQYKIMMQLLDKCIPSPLSVDADNEFRETPGNFDDAKKKAQAQLSENLKILEKMSPMELAQKLFELHFDVDDIQISMFKCLDSESMQCKKLLDFLGGKVKFNFVRKAKGMNLQLKVHSLEVEDHIEESNNDEFKRLISSGKVENDQVKDLFSLEYSRIQRIVTHDNTLIEVFDQDVSMNMAQLQLVLSPKSLLTLLNYALTTFTNPDAPAAPADALRHNEENREDAPQKFNLNISVAGVVMVFNDDSLKLATLVVSAGDFSLLYMPEKMKVNMSLGGLELTDETTEDLPRDSVFRKLICMSDHELAEISYETFDATDNPENYDSFLKYNTGSMHINFVEHSINKLLVFFCKFQKMKTLFDKAREVAYNQAPSIEAVNKMKMDVQIKAPVIQFPRIVATQDEIYDSVTFHLGEIFVENKFTKNEAGVEINHIKLGIREAQVSSLLNLKEGAKQQLHMVDNLCLTFNIDHNSHADSTSPKFLIKGYFDPLMSSLTELQLNYLYEISERMSSAFDVSDASAVELSEDVIYANAFMDSPGVESTPEGITVTNQDEEDKINPEGLKMDFSFEAPEISLTLYHDTAATQNLYKNGLTKLTFQDIAFSAKYNEDGTGEGNSHIATFTVEDIRDMKDNKHTELIPKVVNDNYQFMASVTINKLESGKLINVSNTIDSPQLILAMDYLLALKSFFDAAFDKNKADITVEDENNAKEQNPSLPAAEIAPSGTKLQYSFNIVNAAIILLADPSDIHSEAVIFNAGQLLLSDQNVISLCANNVGMSLSRMNTEDKSQVRLLEEFSSSLVIDRRESTPEKLLTNVQISVEPMILGISLRDIRLAMLVFNRMVSQMNGKSEEVQSEENSSSLAPGGFSKEFERKLSKYAPSFVSSIEAVSGHASVSHEVVMRGENLEADFGGVRLFLIGDVHEMPILDMNVKPFQASVKDWSTEIDALAALEVYVNVFNYSRSSWEPLVETFPMSFHLSKSSANKDAKVMFDVISKKTAEVTLSSRTIAMLSQIPGTLTAEYRLEPRGAAKPYKIHNDTELNMDIWIVTDNVQERKSLVTLEAGSTLPWEFEDWRSVRENLEADNSGLILGAAISGSRYQTTMKVDATYEGELLFVLQPAVNHVHSRITCELELGDDNIKTITFRSTLLLENATSTDLQIMVEPEQRSQSFSFELKALSSRSIPVEYAFSSSLRIKPLGDVEYDWSQQPIMWRSLLKRPMSLQCNSLAGRNENFHIEVNGKYDEKEPLAQIFPHMKLVLSSPIIIENLLPCDLKFSLFDKKEEEKNMSILKKGERIPIHDVSLDNFLLLRVQPLVDDASMSKPSIVNTAISSVLKPELSLVLKLAGGQKFNAMLHYQSVEGTRAKVIRIASPYIIFNETDRDLYVQGDPSNVCQSKVQIEDDKRFTTPKMFSFDVNSYKKNRARIRFKESDWSIPLSFDALGQSFDTDVSIPNKEQESNFGVTVSEGEGIFLLSKIISIAPRYILHNFLDVPIEICEHGSTNSLDVEPGKSLPLYKMRNIVHKQLMVKFLGSSSEWSSPFFIKDIGFTYLKVLQQDSHLLLKIEIILENATVFIRIKDAENRWPYSIRNFSDQEFIFYQRDPRVVDDYYDYDEFDELDEAEYKPYYYRVPPKSVMPYAWDYPAARQKKLILTARGRRREIQLAEIGNLKPMRLPARTSNEETVSMDLNVIADGPTQALVITNYNADVSLYKLRNKNTSSSISVSSSTGEGFEADAEDKNVYAKIVVSFKGLGISLINASLEEILYLHANGLEMRYNESDLYQTFSWKLKWLQIDNQLFGSPFQNILYPFAVPHTSHEIENHPVISGSISKVKDDSHGLVYFKHATLLLQELTIQLDEDLLIAMLDFVKLPGAVWNVPSKNTHYFDEVTLPQCEDLKFSDDMYFEIFHIQPIMLHVSFVSSDQHQLLKEQQEKLGVEYQGTMLVFMDMLTMTLANVNDAPIKLNSLYMANLRVPISTLYKAIETHYGQQFFYQIHKILGSADFLGNPVGLFNTISSGVWDIFYEPYQGYMMNDRPQELGLHLAKGGLSFAKKTVFGLSDSMAKFTGSMAKGLSITQDLEFQERRRMQQRMNANKGNLLSSTAQTFANTIGSGFTGMAFDPMTGAQKEGASGFFKGLGRGLIGLPTKTAIGILDLTSNLSQGVRSTTTALDVPAAARVRLPRYVDYHEKIIKPYDLKEAQGQYWLKSIDGGLYMNDNYLAHVVLPGNELAVLVSMEHIIELNIGKLESMWTTDYYGIQGIVLQRGGIHIKLKTQSEYFIPIANPQERKSLYKHIAIAVTEYNKYCEAAL